MNYDLIESLIVDLSTDPHNPEKNFKAALEYERLNQTASAVSFYLRAAEYGVGTHPLVVYTSLLKIAKCIETQKDRVYTVSNCLLQAIAYAPERKEGYFLMSQFYERQGQWQESYTWAEMGLWQHTDSVSLLSDVSYYGEYCLEFQKAVAAWWIGRKDESLKIFASISKLDLPKEYQEAIKNNLDRMGHVTL